MHLVHELAINAYAYVSSVFTIEELFPITLQASELLLTTSIYHIITCHECYG